MDDTEYRDAIAAGTVALAGVFAICSILARQRIFDRGDIDTFDTFIAAAIAKSQASPAMQADLHQALAHHMLPIVRLLDDQDEQDRRSGSDM